jgi:hypothetical protein
VRYLQWPKPLLLRALARAALTWLASHIALFLRLGVIRPETIASAWLVAVVGGVTWYATYHARESVWLANLGADPRVAAFIGIAVALLGEAAIRIVL